MLIVNILLTPKKQMFPNRVVDKYLQTPILHHKRVNK